MLHCQINKLAGFCLIILAQALSFVRPPRRSALVQDIDGILQIKSATESLVSFLRTSEVSLVDIIIVVSIIQSRNV